MVTAFSCKLASATIPFSLLNPNSIFCRVAAKLFSQDDSFIGNFVVDAVVEDHAVLQYFNHRCSFVFCRGCQQVGQVVQIHVNGPSEKCAACSEAKLCRIKGSSTVP